VDSTADRHVSVVLRAVKNATSIRVVDGGENNTAFVHPSDERVCQPHPEIPPCALKQQQLPRLDNLFGVCRVEEGKYEKKKKKSFTDLIESGIQMSSSRTHLPFSSHSSMCSLSISQGVTDGSPPSWGGGETSVGPWPQVASPHTCQNVEAGRDGEDGKRPVSPTVVRRDKRYSLANSINCTRTRSLGQGSAQSPSLSVMLPAGETAAHTRVHWLERKEENNIFNVC